MIKNKIKLLSVVAVSSLLMATACSDNTDYSLNTGEKADGNHIVTISFQPQQQSIATRADDDSGNHIPDDNTFTSHISDGKKVDVLIFEVYHSDTADGDYTLAKEFQKSEVPVKGITPGVGQNIIEVTENFWPFQLQLVVDPDKYYKVVAWAQNSEFKAFDTKSLCKVRIDYSGNPVPDHELDPDFGVSTNDFYLNNNELSDAFCGVSSHAFKGDNELTQEVILHRPFAQINIATSGWDYEGTALLNPNKAKYLYSAIAVKGVGQYYDVLNGRTLTQDEQGNSLLTDVFFNFNTLPAFYNYSEWEIASSSAVDISKDELLYIRRGDYVGKEADFNIKNGNGFYDYLTWHRYFNFKGALSDKEYEDNYKEEDQFKGKKYYIYAKTDDEGNTTEYITEREPEEGQYDENTLEGPYTTSELFQKSSRCMIASEVYKYMSMCYILVPESTDSEGNPTGSTVDIEFSMKGKLLEDGFASGAEKQTEWFKLNNVPVQKNWRTNIIGEGFLMVNHNFNFYVIPDYCGEYDDLYEFDDPNNKDAWLWEMDWVDNGDSDDWYLKGGGYIYDGFNTKFGEDYHSGMASKPKPY